MSLIHRTPPGKPKPKVLSINPGTMVQLAGFYQKLKSFWSCSHMTHIIYIHFIKFNLNLNEFQESNNYFKSYQMSKIEYFAELYFNLNLHLNLNVKLDFQANS